MLKKEWNENMIWVQEGDLEYLQFKKLKEYENIVKHAFAIKPQGYRFFSNKLEEWKNYQKLCETLGLDGTNLVRPIQMHTNIVEVVKEKVNKDMPDMNLECYRGIDGLITNQKNRILATINADCNLILFFDPVLKVIGNVHSGWRGTFQRISQVGVQRMVDTYGCNPKNILCFLCPSIHQCHFEVDRDVRDLCRNQFTDIGSLEDIIEEDRDRQKWKIDLVEITKRVLRKEGILEKNIIDSGICSVCHADKIHSYRADKEMFNQNTAIISLV